MARDFDSANPDLAGVATASVVSAYPFTMATWFRQTGTEGTGGQTLMNVADDSSNAIYYRLVVNEGGTNRLEAERRNTTLRSSVTSGTITNNVWGHAAGVYASNTSMLSYLDGVAGTEDTNSVTFAGTVGVTSLGYLLRATPTQFLDGQLAESAFWDAALTAEEIAALAKGFSPLCIRPESLAAYWPLHGNKSPETNWINQDHVMALSGTTKADHPRIIYPRRRRIMALERSAAPAFYHFRRRRA